MLDWLYEAIAWLLAVFYSVVPNLGVAIILLTFTIMLILYPLTAKQAKSMMAMQRVQPEIKKLQAKYKNDRQKLNEEMMKFYQENKINPLAGCLPLLAQMPIFISLFNVLRNSQKYVPTKGSLGQLYADLCHGFENCGVEVTRKIADTFPGESLQIGKPLIHHLKFLGIDLQLTATDPHGGFFDASPYFLLVVLVMLTGFLQSRQAQKRTPVANKQMGVVMKVLPVFFGLISLNFPAGLVLYFFVSNLWRLGQQEVIFRRHGSVLHAPGGKLLDAKSTVRGGKSAEPSTAIEAAAEAEPAAAEEHRAAPAPERVTATTQERSSGLRGLFAMPPPPEDNGGGSRGAAPADPAKGGGSGASRSSQPRRRNKKKRKR
ncbi:MAG: YidC/Oxa1 family membrane protein insertase [Acidimicrobiia bacterium]